MTAEFILTALIIVASPGTGAIYTVAVGISDGARMSVAAAFGCTLGVLPHMLAAITGMAALLHASAAAFETLKILGVLYLLYMAWGIFRDRKMLAVDETRQKRDVGKVVSSAVLINLLNPKLSIFFLAFLPQFVSVNDPAPVTSMLALSAVFMALTFIIFAAYGIFSAVLRRHVVSSVRVQTWMRRGFAAAFVGLALQLAITQR